MSDIENEATVFFEVDNNQELSVRLEEHLRRSHGVPHVLLGKWLGAHKPYIGRHTVHGYPGPCKIKNLLNCLNNEGYTRVNFVVNGGGVRDVLTIALGLERNPDVDLHTYIILDERVEEICPQKTAT